eukprot:scaffold3118_cov264-Pinguiococcus_pyrenoidosus.AAC.5
MVLRSQPFVPRALARSRWSSRGPRAHEATRRWNIHCLGVKGDDANHLETSQRLRNETTERKKTKKNQASPRWSSKEMPRPWRPMVQSAGAHNSSALMGGSVSGLRPVGKHLSTLARVVRKKKEERYSYGAKPQDAPS